MDKKHYFTSMFFPNTTLFKGIRKLQVSFKSVIVYPQKRIALKYIWVIHNNKKYFQLFSFVLL